MTVPLKILITDSSLLDNEQLVEQVAKLEKAGHNITVDDKFKEYDFITGPNCWLLRPEVAGLFKLAIDNARKVANADQKRADAHSLIKASKKSAKRAGKVGGRSTKVTKPVASEQHSIPSGQQLDLTTVFDTDQTGSGRDEQADSFGAGS